MNVAPDSPLNALTLDADTDADAGAEAEVVVVGGGLAGLTAAIFAARAGARVVLLERAATLGGRAATHEQAGFSFNIGPHALYVDGAASRVLKELGVSYSGRRPPVSGGLAYAGGQLHALPGGFVSLLTTGFLSLAGKLEIGKALGGLGKIDVASLRGRTLGEWLSTSFHDPSARQLIEGLLRLTSYGDDPGRACAAAAVRQLQLGMATGVVYLDGGWATLVAGLRQAAEAAGVRVRTSARVSSLRVGHAGFEVEIHSMPASRDGAEELAYLSNNDGKTARSTEGAGGALRAKAVVLALPPVAAASIGATVAAEPLRAWANAAIPIKAACLDLGLRRLPNPRRLFALGMDRPLYFSVHTASARLAPEGASLVHVAKYLGPDGGGAGSAKDVEAELEAFCDAVQPGWRSEVAHRRFLPSILVSGALVAADSPRPESEVPGCPGLFVAGDWVGGEGMIADTAVASGRQAGRLAAAAACGVRRVVTAAA